MLLLGLALLLAAGPNDHAAPPAKAAPAVRLDVADKSFSIATKSSGDHTVIVTALEHSIEAIRPCWATELKAHPRAQGSMSFAFSVLPDGSASRPILKSDTVHDKAVVDCATRALATMTVPLADQTVRIVAPLVFTNGSEPAVATGAATADVDAAIDDILHKGRSMFDSCYSSAKRKDERVAGTIDFDFTVEESGIVRSATISGGTLRSMSMNNCVANALRHLKFAPPAGGRVEIHRSMTFPTPK